MTLTLCSFNIGPFFEHNEQEWLDRKIGRGYLNEALIELTWTAQLQMQRKCGVSAVVSHLGVLSRREIFKIVLPIDRKINT